jgi:hypothetical protein
MSAHVIKGFLPRGFRKFDVSTDLTAEYGLKTANEIADNAGRANRNAPHDAEMPDGLEPYDIICCRDHHGKDSERGPSGATRQKHGSSFCQAAAILAAAARRFWSLTEAGVALSLAG